MLISSGSNRSALESSVAVPSSLMHGCQMESNSEGRVKIIGELSLQRIQDQQPLSHGGMDSLPQRMGSGSYLSRDPISPVCTADLDLDPSSTDLTVDARRDLTPSCIVPPCIPQPYQSSMSRVAPIISSPLVGSARRSWWDSPLDQQGVIHRGCDQKGALDVLTIIAGGRQSSISILDSWNHARPCSWKKALMPSRALMQRFEFMFEDVIGVSESIFQPDLRPLVVDTGNMLQYFNLIVPFPLIPFNCSVSPPFLFPEVR